MKSLYGQYLEEHRGVSILEIKEGFATYEFIGEDCYIGDIFITIEFRGKGFAKDICEAIGDIARKAGCKRIWGSVDPRGKTATDGTKLILAMGMKLVSINNGLIYFVRDL